MPLTLATWNINSVRLRKELVARFLEAEQPDVLCLQEIKCPLDKFPTEFFAERGYGHLVARGQKGYNGVAILGRVPLEDAGHRDGLDRGDARHVAAKLPGGEVLHNFYIPAGGDVPDREKNEKFGHKLDFIKDLTGWFAAEPPKRSILVGDLNIAPLEDDVWSHKQMLKVISHTPIEVEHLTEMQSAGNWVDVTRKDMPEGKVYSWWSYRAKDWAVSNRGRRLDHIWVTPDLADQASGSRILQDWRGAEQPSDHVPVLATLDI